MEKGKTPVADESIEEVSRRARARLAG